MTEGETKKCGQCGIEIEHVEVIDTFENRNTKKLQWQTRSTHKPHFKFAGPGKWKCITPEEIVQESMDEHKKQDAKEELQVQCPNEIEVNDPFREAEIIVAWARDKAYKMVMAEVDDYSKLTQQEKNSLGQKEGMLTRAILDTTLELRKLNGIKSHYAK